MNKTRNLPFILFLAVIGSGSFYYFLCMSPQARARKIEHEYVAAVNELNQSPSGVPRAETFVQRIQAMSGENSPPDIQQDLRDYVNALDQAVKAYKEGSDTTVYDQKSADEKAKLVADLRKYD